MIHWTDTMLINTEIFKDIYCIGNKFIKLLYVFIDCFWTATEYNNFHKSTYYTEIDLKI